MSDLAETVELVCKKLDARGYPGVAEAVRATFFDADTTQISNHIMDLGPNVSFEMCCDSIPLEQAKEFEEYVLTIFANDGVGSVSFMYGQSLI